MDIVERLIAYRDYTGLTNSQFADRAGIPRPTLSQFLNGRNKRLSDDFTVKLHQAYPDLNVMWLLFGEGQMVSSANFEISEGKNQQTEPPTAAKPTDSKEYTSPTAPQQNNLFSQPNSEYEAFHAPEPENEPLKVHDEDPAPYLRMTKGGPMVNDLLANSNKRIQSIMVFYSDNSYELFTPAQSDK